MSDRFWRQDGYSVRCEWGPVGAERVGGDGAIVVIDVLSFTTSISVMVERGTAVYPAAWRDSRAAELAHEHQAALAVGRHEMTDEHRWSLSPAALRRAPAPDRLVLPSPNGSAIAAATSGVVVAACLRNATAVGRWLSQQGYGTDRPLSLIPAGERWPDGSLRPALEDMLGAGAVLMALDVAADALSPEAAAAAHLLAAMNEVSLVEAVRNCGSGQELIEGGYADDVEVAVEIDAAQVVPVRMNGCFKSAAHGR